MISSTTAFPVQMGEYTLTQTLGSREQSDLYLARHALMKKGVVIELFRADEEGADSSRFLATARTVSAHRLPHTAPVLASDTLDGVPYLASELPPGAPLSRTAAQGARLSAVQICSIISAAAEMYQAAQKAGRDTALLTTADIYLKGDQRVTFLSPVLPDDCSDESERRQMVNLTDVLAPLLPVNAPGESRVSTLIHWMLYGYEGRYVSWADIASTAQEIAQQLAPVLTVKDVHLGKVGEAQREQRQAKRARRRLTQALLIAGGMAAGVILMTIAGGMIPQPEVEPYPAVDKEWVHIGLKKGQVRAMARPVSVSEYQKFLNAYGKLSVSAKAAVDKDIPTTCRYYTPEEWQAQRAAADSHSEWQGMKMSSAAPVRGVSYWDALAYSRWKKASLPTARQMATVHMGGAAADCDEWIAGKRSLEPIYEDAHLYFTAAGEQRVDGDPSHRDLNRSFRIVHK